jgi:DMSO/TMAO reductase YedYZ molybdopterin-dependent catalytic subunit
MSRIRSWLLGGLAGFLAAAAGVAVSEAVAALLTGVTSPLLAVGNRAVDATPRQLKELAIETFGTKDKPVLITGVVVTVALIAVVAGAVGVRRPRLAVGVFAALSLVAAAAAVTDRSATASVALCLLPVIALAVVAVGALHVLLRALRAGIAPTGGEGSAASSEVPASFDRRGFLLAAMAVAAVASAGGVVRQAFGGSAAASQRADIRLPDPASPAAPLPKGTSLDVPGISPFVTSNADFYRVDAALSVPDVPIDGYTLRIHGMVDKEIELSFEDLLDRRLVERRITLTCVSNQVGGPYVGNAAWLGIPVRDLLEEAGVRDGADAVKSTSADNFTIGTPLQALTDPHRDALIAIGMNGEPLPLKHGFPVRMVVPGLYGYVSATKWLVDLEVTRFADFKAYWSTRGYSVKAPIKTSSRIDVPHSFARVRSGTKVPVAGVAWSQDRGIRRVEVRVDGGAWQQAELAELDNIDTWRQWRWLWDAEPGNHTIEVRATDETGYTQTEKRSPIAPNGSTGWHSVNVTAA